MIAIHHTKTTKNFLEKKFMKLLAVMTHSPKIFSIIIGHKKPQLI